jgi:hypothetical protein
MPCFSLSQIQSDLSLAILSGSITLSGIFLALLGVAVSLREAGRKDGLGARGLRRYSLAAWSSLILVFLTVVTSLLATAHLVGYEWTVGFVLLGFVFCLAAIVVSAILVIRVS